MSSKKKPQTVKMPPEGVTILRPDRLEISIPSQGPLIKIRKPFTLDYEGHKVVAERVATINFEASTVGVSSALQFCYPDPRTVVIVKEGVISPGQWSKKVTSYTDEELKGEKRVEKFYPNEGMQEILHSNKPFETKAGGFSVTAYPVERRFSDGREEYGAVCDDPREGHQGEKVYRPFKGGREEFYKKLKAILRQQPSPESFSKSEQRAVKEVTDVPGGMIAHYDDKTEERTFDDRFEILDHRFPYEIVIEKEGREVLVEATPLSRIDRLSKEMTLYWEYTDPDTGEIALEPREVDQQATSDFFRALIREGVVPKDFDGREDDGGK
ncbi:MAG: hypothetical protein V1746_04640 [bacterium]